LHLSKRLPKLITFIQQTKSAQINQYRSPNAPRVAR
jgi:hypothetical protein